MERKKVRENRMKNEIRRSVASALITSAAVAMGIIWSNVALEAFGVAGVARATTGWTWLNWGYYAIAAAIATIILTMAVVCLDRWSYKD